MDMNALAEFVANSSLSLDGSLGTLGSSINRLLYDGKRIEAGREMFISKTNVDREGNILKYNAANNALMYMHDIAMHTDDNLLRQQMFHEIRDFGRELLQ